MAKKRVKTVAGKVNGEARGSATIAGWTCLCFTNHAQVLTVLHAQPDWVVREVAQRVGITERAVFHGCWAGVVGE